MKNAKRVALILAFLAALSACKPHDGSVPVVDASAPSGTESDGSPRAKNSFDIESIPVSNVALGEFPYIALPAGYSTNGFSTETKDFARFPFWVKGESHWVEGRMYLATFGTEAGKSVSEYEVKKNFDALVQKMGGQKISEEKIPDDAIKGWGEEITQGFNSGLGDVYNGPATTYLIRRDDGNIWIHLAISGSGNYVVAKEKGFESTAKLLPAAELKQQLDATGKVALQVNFATDKTEMLPDSLPQIDQVMQLLKDDPALKLSVNGHTDNSGDAAHNQQLSEGRANAVVAAIVAKGIDATRLGAKGFGQQQPVADNATEEGKAKNRRVELVKQQ
jgi:outer membrane protein OmpA-like peptidoglycan-associated protein